MLPPPAGLRRSVGNAHPPCVRQRGVALHTDKRAWAALAASGALAAPASPAASGALRTCRQGGREGESTEHPTPRPPLCRPRARAPACAHPGRSRPNRGSLAALPPLSPPAPPPAPPHSDSRPWRPCWAMPSPTRCAPLPPSLGRTPARPAPSSRLCCGGRDGWGGSRGGADWAAPHCATLPPPTVRGGADPDRQSHCGTRQGHPGRR